MGKLAKYQRYTKKTKLEAVRRVLEKDEPVQAVLNDLGIRHRDNIYHSPTEDSLFNCAKGFSPAIRGR